MLVSNIYYDVDNWLNRHEGNYVKVTDTTYSEKFTDAHNFRNGCEISDANKIYFFGKVSYSMFEMILNKENDIIVPHIHFRPKTEWKANSFVRILDNNTVSITFEEKQRYRTYSTDIDIKLENVYDVTHLYEHLEHLTNTNYSYRSWTCDDYFQVIPKLETMQYLLNKNGSKQDYSNIIIEI